MDLVSAELTQAPSEVITAALCSRSGRLSDMAQVAAVTVLKITSDHFETMIVDEIMHHVT